MLSRGYEGAIPLVDQTRFGLADAVFLGATLGFVLAIRISVFLWGWA
jgi:hypothetical protein